MIADTLNRSFLVTWDCGGEDNTVDDTDDEEAGGDSVTDDEEAGGDSVGPPSDISLVMAHCHYEDLLII